MLSLRIRLLHFCLSVTTVFISFLLVSLVQAAEISLTVNVNATEDKVHVDVTNVGRDAVPNVRVKVELNHQVYESEVKGQLAAKETFKTLFTVTTPERPGSYPLYSTVYYVNDGETLTLTHVGKFNWGKSEELQTDLVLPAVEISEESTVQVNFQKGYEFRLVLPEEISVIRYHDNSEGREYFLRNLRPKFQSGYDIFAVVETPDSAAVKSSKIVSSRLKTIRFRDKRGLFSARSYFIFGVLGFLATFVLYLRRVLPAEKGIPDAQICALIRWCFSIFVVSLLLFAFRTLHVIPDHVVQYLRAENYVPSQIPDDLLGRWFRRTVIWVIGAVRVVVEWGYFDNDTYATFAQKIADPLYLYMLLGNYFVLRYVIRPEPTTDKYWHLMLAVCSCFKRRPKTKRHWSPLCKVAILALMVKAFYVPLLPSWAINDFHHQWNLINSFSWNYVQVNQFLVALFIFVDVSIFAVGYLVELPGLKNQIKTVEPTLLGWTVCLMCYPPFNSFSFSPFDWSINDFFALIGIDYVYQWSQPGEFIQQIGLAAVTILWGIYVWATIALGWRSSNLTNRGIVSWGPYAYVRHPAYISKCTLWAVEGYIHGTWFLFLVLGWFFVYYLRARTEERHLSLDPDYLTYKKKVRWKFIPKVY